MVWGSLDLVQRDPIYVSWLRPDEGYVCVNVDGSSQVNLYMFRFGGLVWNNEGHWKVGFSGFCGFGSNLLPELLAIKHGLDVASDRGP